MRAAGVVLWAGALALALAVAPLGAQQFLLPESLSPGDLDTGGGLQGGAGAAPGLRSDRPRGRVQDTLQIETEAAPVGVLRGLDRISGQTRDVTLTVGAQAELFGRLTVTLMDCRYPAGDPASNAFAYVAIEDRLRTGPIFRGWMIAASPALNALDHARYDVWALRCSKS